MENKLLPCPFFGGEAEAIEAWNTRAEGANDAD